MQKVLFVATIFKHFRAFHLPFMKRFQERGWQVDLAAGGDDIDLPFQDHKFRINVQRTPFSWKNVIAYFELKRIVKEENYDIVYCHTAMGAVISRLACRSIRKKGKLKVVYVAHGFHFFKGGPLQNWLIYFPMEWLLSRYTDALVTINKEDYDLASKYFSPKALYKIDGIGLDLSRFSCVTPEQKMVLRREKGVKETDFVLIYIAEYIHRKNHRFILESVSQLKAKIPGLRILFAGRGALMDSMQRLAEALGVIEDVDFLGFRMDIPDLVALSDVGISASKQEGMGMNLIEEMSVGLPVVATQDRGHREIVIHGKNGFLFPQGDTDSFIKHIVFLYENPSLRIELGEKARYSIEKFSLEKSVLAMEQIFSSIVLQDVK